MINIIIIEGSKKFIEDSKVKIWNEESYKEQNLKNLQKKFGTMELNVVYLYFDGKESIKTDIEGEKQKSLWQFSSKAHDDLISKLELYNNAPNNIHFIINAHGGVGLPRLELPKVGKEREFIEVFELSKLLNNFSSALKEMKKKHTLEIQVKACHFMAEKESNFLNRNFPPFQLTSFEKISNGTSTASFFTNRLNIDNIILFGPASYNFSFTAEQRSIAPKTIKVEKAPNKALNSEEWLEKYEDKFSLHH